MAVFDDDRLVLEAGVTIVGVFANMCTFFGDSMCMKRPCMAFCGEHPLLAA
jgi:hypothetical protein